MTVSSPDHLESGDLLAERFRLDRPLGQGAMGRVWLAHDIHLNDDPVACKLMAGALNEDRRAIAYLKREVLLTRRLRHVSIVGVYTFWDVEGLRFITMEYVPGRNLSDILNTRDEPFSLEEALPWVGQISQALDYAHEQGVLHRDVKPANVLLGDDGMARLADFGIARTLSDMKNRITGGVTCGTVMFMSPEQLLGESVDTRSDLYSLAASVYELLAGSPPFYTGSIVAQIQSKPAPRIHHLSDGANAALLRALSKKPGERHPSCSAFFEDLAAAVRERPSGAPAPQGLDPDRITDPDTETVKLDPEDLASFPDRVGMLLLEAGALTAAQLEEALAAQQQTDERLGVILKRLGYIDETAMARALEQQLRIPYLALADAQFDPEVTGLIGAAFAKTRKCVPLHRVGGRALVAMADPLDFNTLNVLEEIYGGQVVLRIATDSDIAAAIGRIYG